MVGEENILSSRQNFKKGALTGFETRDVLFESADFWICVAHYYWINDGRVSASDSLITLREDGIQFWRPRSSRSKDLRNQKLDDGQTICPFVLFSPATKIQSTLR